MTKKEIIKKLAIKYVELYGNGYSCSNKEDAQLDLLDEIIEEWFSIENIYVDNGRLMSKGKIIGFK